MTPSFLLMNAAIIALVAAFILSLLIKIGIIEYMQVFGSPLIIKLANCAFCLSFWTTTVLAIVLTVTLQDALLVLVPFISTPITKFLVFN